MKKIYFFLRGVPLIIGIILLISGCKEEVTAEARFLTVSSPSGEDIAVSGDGGTFDLSVQTNLQWTVKAESDGSTAKWVTFSQSSGIGDGTVTVTVQKGRFEPRTAVVTVMSKDELVSHSFNVTQEASGEAPEVEGYVLPAYSIFQNINDRDVSLGIANAEIDGGACKFEGGATITMSGAASEVSFASSNYYQVNAKFTGWGAEDAKDIIVRIPVKEELSGDLRMFWGWTSTVASSWKVYSGIDGENWTDTGTIMGFTKSARFNRTLFFSVPGTVPAGGSLYLRLVPETALAASEYVQFCTGFLLTRAKPDETVLPSGDKVLYTCDFNNVTIGCPYNLPLGYLRSSAEAFDASAFGYDGMGKSGTVAGEWGSVRIGSASGEAAIILPPLSEEKLGNGTADVKVSFKAVLYQSADYLNDKEGKASCNIAVSVAEGDGTVENGEITDLDNWTDFEERSVVIEGVSKNTRIRIGISGGSGDRRFYLDDVVVEAVSDITIPSEPNKTLTEILSGGDGTITEPVKTTVTVLSDQAGANLPANTAVVTDGTSYAALNFSSATSLAPGTKVTLRLKGAVLDKKASTLSVSPEMIAEKEDGASPAPESATVSQLSSLEYHLVEVKNIQATESFIGKTFSGEVLMENADKETFGLNIYPSASFAGGVIPENSGSVKGIVIGGRICPRTAEDINLVLDRIGSGGVKLFKPVFCTYDFTSGSTTPQIKNASVSGQTVSFTNGGCIERIGGAEGEMAFAQGKTSTPYNVYLYSTGWNVDDTYWRLSCPAAEDISGKVAVTFSLNSSAKEVQQVWNIFWSNDGESWTPTEYTWNKVNNTDVLATEAKNTFKAQSTTSNGITRTEFTVPSGKKISAGKNLYIKIVPTTTLTSAATKVQLGFGFYVAPGDVLNMDRPADALIFNNFSECTAGTDYMLGSEVRYFGNVTTPAYSKDGWTVVSGFSRTGYSMFGTASSGNHGVTTPEIGGLNGKSDVTVSFKCCLYMPSSYVGAKDDICVKVAAGEGTVGELVWDSAPESDYYGWHTATVKISGVSSATRIFIGAGAGKSEGDRRFFLDDIVVK